MVYDYYAWLNQMRGAQPPKQEPPPDNADPAGDPPNYGLCCVRTCKGVHPIWLVPNDGKWYCAKHLRVVVERAAWWKP